MSNTKSRKLLSLVLALVMLMGTFVIPAYADTSDNATEPSNKNDLTKDDFAAILATVSYQQYLDANVKAKHPDKTVKADITSFEVEGGEEGAYKLHTPETCDADCIKNHKGQDICFESGETGKAVAFEA